MGDDSDQESHCAHFRLSCSLDDFFDINLTMGDKEITEDDLDAPYNEDTLKRSGSRVFTSGLDSLSAELFVREA